jgi:hypothetical protein
MRYAWGALMLNGFAGRGTTLFNNQEILGYYSLAGHNKWLFLLYESLFFVAFFFFAWLALSFVKHQRR